MTTKKLGRRRSPLPPASVAGTPMWWGKRRGGPLADSFDQINQDDSFGEKTWEKAETAMQKLALSSALDKAGLSASALDYILAGDLLNQCIGSGFAVRGQDVPFFGCMAPVPLWRRACLWPPCCWTAVSPPTPPP